MLSHKRKRALLIDSTIQLMICVQHVIQHTSSSWTLWTHPWNASIEILRKWLVLQALKERLVERANIIQARHDAETAALVKRQVREHIAFVEPFTC